MTNYLSQISQQPNLTKFNPRLESAPLQEEGQGLRELRNGRSGGGGGGGGEGEAISMTQRKFSMKRMALKSKFGFTKINHNYTEDERQVSKLSPPPPS